MKLITTANMLDSVLVSVFLLASCSSPSTTLEPEKISLANGVLNIVVLPGSVATEDCGINVEELEVEEVACVAFPLSSKIDKDKNWDAEYLQALNANEWKWAGGEGNAYYLEKPKSDECSYRLTMMGWLQGPEDEVRRYFDTGELGNIENQTYIFAIEDDLKCGDDRRVK